LPPDFNEKVTEILDLFPSRIDEYEDLLTNNPIWRNRTIGVAKISPEDAIKCGFTGPLLRACGIEHDLRKTNPYSSYEKFDFDIPTDDGCDVYARYLVKLVEMRQSLRIIKQTLDGMPEGAYMADAPGIVLPPKERVLTEMEALIFHFKIITEGFHPPVGEVYQGIESPKGELGFYIVSDGGPYPYRMRVRPPCFVHTAALGRLCEGGLVADVIAAIGSIDIVLGEVDR
jgi:NADH-quinone oxidoreductase subunit D